LGWHYCHQRWCYSGAAVGRGPSPPSLHPRAAAMSPGVNVTVSESVAALEASAADLDKAVNVMWVLLCTCLVFWEQAGFAMWEAGSLPTRSLHSILLKNMCDAAIGAAAFFVCGYAFAFGGGNAFIGDSYFFLVGLDETEYYKWFFQWAFAATAATTVSGCMAERTSFVAYLGYSFCITSVIYATVVHWVWVREPLLRPTATAAAVLLCG
jgi:Amt family ammonium transporter